MVESLLRCNFKCSAASDILRFLFFNLMGYSKVVYQVAIEESDGSKTWDKKVRRDRVTIILHTQGKRSRPADPKRTVTRPAVSCTLALPVTSTEVPMVPM